jgi:hypothetical protein
MIPRRREKPDDVARQAVAEVIQQRQERQQQRSPNLFQPGHTLSPGRAPGARTRTTNLVVSGIADAIIRFGCEYAASKGLPADHNVMSDVDAFSAFMGYCIEKDLRGFLSLVKGLIPRDVVLTFTQPLQVEVLPPPDLKLVLEQKGLRLPPEFQLSAAHKNDDDPEVSEAEIAAVVDNGK